MATQTNRPVHLNLMKFRLPIAGVMSIGHRISGFFMALALPCVLYLFDVSLDGHQNFARAKELLDTLPIQIVLFLLLWALLHHYLAGIRYLLLDVDVGIDKPYYRVTAWLVMLGAPISALLLLGGLL